ncbi:MAG TPA: hypothetical protein VFO60_08930, partial [Candidatus Dormibacteraeota bacterium]|nr:hypothetical protein [Candidatus Dormibacteraeota bacterium]
MRTRSRFHVAAVGAVLGVSALATAAGTAPVTQVAVRPFIHEVATGVSLTSPPTTAFCRANLGRSCYQPFQLVKGYDLAPLHDAGIDGRGETIVIVD